MIRTKLITTTEGVDDEFKMINVFSSIDYHNTVKEYLITVATRY